MRQSAFDFVTPIDRGSPPCRCSHLDGSSADEAELVQLFRDLEQTLFRVMDHNHADIFERCEVQGQTLSRIACETGCSRSEATRRLAHARRCICHLVVLTLAPAKSE